MFLHIPRAHQHGQICIIGFVSKICLEKSSCVSKIPPVPQKNRRITDSVFVPTLQLSALLLKSFSLRLHCYTLWFRFRGVLWGHRDSLLETAREAEVISTQSTAKRVACAAQGHMRLAGFEADSKGTSTVRGRQCKMSKKDKKITLKNVIFCNVRLSRP